MSLRLTLACGDSDRTRALLDGDVTPEGVELTAIGLPIEELFFRMLRGREFDVAELSLSSYAASQFSGSPWLVAIPAFPSRAFRHGFVYVNRASAIEHPEDLRGRTVGTPEYEVTAGVWIRGILAEHHGVGVGDVRYVTGGLEDPARREKLELELPDDIEVTPLGPGRTLSQALLDGEIDALYTPRAPSVAGRPEIGRLWPDPEAVERAYFESTRIFPIMHTVVIRRELYERERWLARSLLKAFTDARDRGYARLRETAALSYMVPWLVSSHQSTVELMGEDFWAYGLEPNRETLATFLRYHHEQGLSPRLLHPDELFAPETLEAFAI